jgi:hypothetical protein
MTRAIGALIFLAAQHAYAGGNEVVEITFQSEKSLTAAVPLTGEKSCAKVKLLRQGADYDLNVCHEEGEPGAPLLHFDIERRDKASTQIFRVNARIARGEKLALGKILDSDGTQTVVWGSLR